MLWYMTMIREADWLPVAVVWLRCGSARLLSPIAATAVVVPSVPSLVSAMSAALEIERSTNPVTLTRFLMTEARGVPGSTGSFTMLLQSIQLACKVIANATRKAGIANLFGAAAGQTANTSGDTQKKLDVLANDVMINVSCNELGAAVAATVAAAVAGCEQASSVLL